jgi:hypothetical protein
MESRSASPSTTMAKFAVLTVTMLSLLYSKACAHMDWVIDTAREVIKRERQVRIESFILIIFMIVAVGDAARSLDDAAVIGVR